MAETYAQRMRVTFASDDTVKYVGHLDMARAWERAIRRARLPLAYTQGFNPQPRIQFAAALPVGFTGRAELIDIYLNEALEPPALLAALAAALPRGIRLVEAAQVPRELPSLQSQLSAARYRVEVEAGEDGESFREKLAGFMARESAMRERRRGKDTVRYDLRPLVRALAYLGPVSGGHSFTVTMRSDPGATGRPDELLAELGFETTPRRVVREELLFSSGGQADDGF
jgi:radical SAM-linked protein